MESTNNTNEVQNPKQKIFDKPFFVTLACLVLIISLLVLPTYFFTARAKCGATFLGNGYYSSDVLWSTSAQEITLCKDCAKDSWGPLFDYRNYAK